MKRKNLLYRVACLLLALTLFPVPAFAQGEAQKATNYIVKRRPGLFRASLQSQVPFEVVEGEELLSLLQQGEVEWYEEDYEVELLDDSPWYASKMWHLSMAGADLAYGLEKTGQGVRVGVVDSGCAKHPALSQCLAQGWNFVNDTADTADTLGHGTAVCGLIAGSGQDGMYGPAPGATLVPLKCFETETAPISTICQGIYAGVDQFDCQVLNMSVGVTSASMALQEAVDHAAQKGVILVAAAGNGGTAAYYYPATYDQAIGVGSVDQYGNWYSRSNHNSSVFLAAPGYNVTCASRFGGQTTMTGTSFATPQVTGAVAVLKSIDPSLDLEDIETLLAETAVDRGTQGKDPYYGYGILDLRGAVQRLVGESSCYILDPAAGDQSFTLYNDTNKAQSAHFLTLAQNQAGDRWVDRAETLTLPAYSQVTASRTGEEATAILCGPDFDRVLALRRLMAQEKPGQHPVTVTADKTVKGEDYLLLAVQGTYTVGADTTPYGIAPDTILYGDVQTAQGSQLSFDCPMGKDGPCTFFLSGLFSDSQEPQQRVLGVWEGWSKEKTPQPPTLTNYRASAGNGTVTLSWQVNPNDCPVVSVNVTRVGGQTVTLDSGKTSYSFTGLANGTAYSFRLSLT